MGRSRVTYALLLSIIIAILAGGSESYGAGLPDAWLIKVAGAAVPSQNSSYTVEKPIEKSTPGFEVILAISMFLGVYIAGRKKKPIVAKV